jgi:NTP pyrophosphatase (non-canonical NTP hydrolase)
MNNSSGPKGKRGPARDTGGMDLVAWQNRLDAFAAERGWGPYLNPKNIAMALSVEAAELVELYQWASPAEAAAFGKTEPAQREQVADELADVLLYLLQMARATGIDLEAAAEAKFAKNALKYPVPKG